MSFFRVGYWTAEEKQQSRFRAVHHNVEKLEACIKGLMQGPK